MAAGESVAPGPRVVPSTLVRRGSVAAPTATGAAPDTEGSAPSTQVAVSAAKEEGS